MKQGRQDMVSTDAQEPRPRVPGGGSLARSEEGGRSSEDEPARCGKPRQAVARGRAHGGVGAGRAPRGDARSLACPSGSEEGPPGQAPADLVIDAAAGTHPSGQYNVGTSPHEMADVAEARASPCFRPASTRSWQGALKSRSTPCL